MIQISMRMVDLIEVQPYFAECVKVAVKSGCFRSKCGAIVVDDFDTIIGRGFNSPPKGIILTECFKDSIPRDFKSNRDCCMHAEQRALIDAVYTGQLTDLRGCRLYFLRLDLANQVIPSGRPYCTICSKMALDLGIDKWVLFHKAGTWGNAEDAAFIYDAQEYNDFSFQYRE